MRLLLLLAMVLSLSSCAKEDDGNMGKFSKPDTLPQKFSYVYGFLLAEAAADYRDMDYSQVIHGISDYSYSSPEFSAPEMNDILTRYQQLLLADMESRRAALAESNRASAAEVLRINGKVPGRARKGRRKSSLTIRSPFLMVRLPIHSRMPPWISGVSSAASGKLCI